MTIAVHSWPPYSGRNLQYFGTAPHVVSEVLADQPIQVRFVFAGWAEALDQLANREVDGAIVWVSPDMKLDPFVGSDPLLKHRAVLYYRKDSPHPGELRNLPPLRMVWQPSYVYDYYTYNRLADKTLTPVPVSNETDGFTQLLNGQADVFLLPYLASRPAVKTLSPSQQEKLAYQIQEVPFPSTHLLLNRQQPDAEPFLRAFNNGLKRLQQDGRYADITAIR